jgi:hypothetical protein
MTTAAPDQSNPGMTLDEFFAEAKRLRLRMPLTHEQMCAAFDAKDATISALAARLELAEKAIEFAGYLAQGTEHLLDKLNAEDAARQAVEDGDGEPELEEALQAATDGRCEHATGARKDLYEFRRRAGRARMAPRPALLESELAHTQAALAHKGQSTGEADDEPTGALTARLQAAERALASAVREANNPRTALAMHMLVGAGAVSQDNADAAFRAACELMNRERRRAASQAKLVATREGIQG